LPQSLRYLVLLAAALAAFLAPVPPAAAQEVVVPGLVAEALIVEDVDGIPHLCASSERDAMFLQGWVHARDRFFQMDRLRRQFSGTLAELLGAAALPADVQLRTLGLRRAAEESLTAYGQLASQSGSTTLQLLEAYTAGVNAYLERHPLPAEYGALEIQTVPPWTVLDSLTVGKGLAFGLSFDLVEIELSTLLGAYQALADVVSPPFDPVALLFEDLVRSQPFDDRVSLPGALPAQSQAATAEAASRRPALGSALDPRAARLAGRYRERAHQVPLLERALTRRESSAGSNWWVLDGSRTATGQPMIANDPHLGLDTPATFYEVHLLVSDTPGCGISGQISSGDGPLLPADLSLNVAGVSFAGAPGIVQGCNDRICWGSTVNPMDVTDVYLEELVIDPGLGLPVATRFGGGVEPLLPIPQVFRVNAIGDGVPDTVVNANLGPTEGGVTLIVPRRNRGPIIQVDLSEQPPVALSVQYTGFRATFEFEAFLRFMRAGTVPEFRAGVQFFDFGSQNWAYADVDGNIAYFTSGELPLREDLQNLGFPDGGIPPFLIRDGTHTLRHEWLPVPGALEPQQALGYAILPFGEMPQATNPARGWIANANNDPIGTTLDNNPLNQLRPGGGLLYLSPGYASERMGRIDRELEDLLAGGGRVTRADLESLQANHQLLDAELIRPFLLGAFLAASSPSAPPALGALGTDPRVVEAVARLGGWDFSTPTGVAAGYDPGDDPDDLPQPSAGEAANSVAATLWAVFRSRLIANTIDRTLGNAGLADFRPGGRDAYRAVAHLLRTFDQSQGRGVSGFDFFTGAPGGLSRAQERDWILLQSLRDALDLLAGPSFAAAFGGSTDQDDYRWGRLHRIVFDHPLGGPFNVPAAGGFANLAPGLPGVARSGGWEAVDASAHDTRADAANDFMFGSGPARRFVGELTSDGPDAVEVLPGGNSGQLGDPRYANQLGRWLTNRYHPLRVAPASVRAAAVSEQPFVPAVTGGSCVPDAETLCLHGERFRLRMTFTTPQGTSGDARKAGVQTDDSGLFTFFSTNNWEILVKVLDGCPLNQRFWVFAAGATNVGWTLTVEDTETGTMQTYGNPVGQRSITVTDTNAFATCP
jgi:penicillin amidase